MRRVVLDTNCLLQALPSRSPYHKIWTEILAGRISLCVNTDILNEYEEILAEKTSAEIAHNVVEAIARLNTTEFQEVYIHFGLIEADPDDKGGVRDVDNIVEGTSSWIAQLLPTPSTSLPTTRTSTFSSRLTGQNSQSSPLRSFTKR